MAFFAVTVEAIDVVSPIPNADRIQMATLKGKDFQFVIAKDSFASGDPCFYFPVDSLVPADLIEKMGLTGKLSGKDKNRIKTVKLRGQISQGLVAKMDIVPSSVKDLAQTMTPEAFTALIGVAKYEPPEVPCNDCFMRPLPDGLSVYDIEGADRYTEIAERLMTEPVFITEKLEGSNFSVQAKVDGTIRVNSRRNTIIEKPGVENMFWKVARRQRLDEFAKKLVEEKGNDAVVYGEIIGPGIQKNIYKLKEHEVRIFDIKVGGKWLAPNEMVKAMIAFFDAEGKQDQKMPCVPYLFMGNLRDFLKGQTIKQASNGMSMLEISQKREGIVIRPMTEADVEGFGRLILKQRSPEYLSESDT